MQDPCRFLQSRMQFLQNNKFPRKKAPPKSKTPLQATGYQACCAAEQRGIWPSRHSSNIHANMAIFLIARGNKIKARANTLKTKISLRTCASTSLPSRFLTQHPFPSQKGDPYEKDDINYHFFPCMLVSGRPRQPWQRPAGHSTALEILKEGHP